MPYETSTEGVTMMQSLTIQDFEKNPQIKHTRRTLLILLSLGLVLTVISLVQKLVVRMNSSSTQDQKRVATSGSEEIVDSIISLIYLVAFIIVVAKYRRTASLVCAWMTILELIGVPVIVISAIIDVSKLSPETGGSDVASTAIMTFIFTVVITAALFLAIALYSFQLVKLMETPSTLQIV